MGIVLLGTFLGFWIYNAKNRLVTTEIEDVETFHLPNLTLCVPGGSFVTTPHVFIFKQYNLTAVREPGDFVSGRDIQVYCRSNSDCNACGDFIKYDGDCVHIGLNNDTYPWNLKTAGQTVLSFTLVYPPRYYDVLNLILPFFGWTTDCTVEKDGSLRNVERCTKKKHTLAYLKK